MWLGWILASAVVLSAYDLVKKISVKGNAVFPTLLGTTIAGWLAVSVWSLGRGEFAASFFISGTSITLLLLKSVLVGSSWTCTYLALRTLPITTAAPIRATAPLWTLLGAITLFREIPTHLQLLGMACVFGGCFLLTCTARRDDSGRVARLPILYSFAGTLLGSCSALYDKYLLHELHLPTLTVLWWYLGGLTLIYLVLCLVTRVILTPKDKFFMRWSIPLVGLFLSLADGLYMQAVATPDAQISVLSLMRRLNVVLTFFVGAIIFREKDLFKKIPALVVIVTGIIILSLAR